MVNFIAFDECDGEPQGDPFAVCSESVLLAMGLIDDATMQQLLQPWLQAMEMAA